MALRRVQIVSLAVAAALLGGFGTGCVALSGAATSMQISSNAPETTVRVRPSVIGQPPDWTDAGKGPTVLLTDLSNQPIEVEASAPGYVPKTLRFVEPLPFFTFALERSGPPPPPPPTDDKKGDLPPFSGRRRALIVGVSGYNDAGYRYLKAAKEEAEALARFLKSPEGGNYAPDLVMVLTEKNATKASIMGELYRMADGAEEGDLILFIFSGHGRVVGAERYLIPYDGVFAVPPSGIEHADVKRLLDKYPKTYQMVMLDTCFAGTIRSGEEEHPMVSISSSPHRCVLTSTKGNESGYDPSPFAEVVLDALSGRILADLDGNGNIMASELHASIWNRVHEIAEKHGDRMTPQLYNPEFAEKVNLVRRRK